MARSTNKEASGEDYVVINSSGDLPTATEDGAIAIGQNADALEFFGTAIGTNARVRDNAFNAVAIGYGSDAREQDCISIGNNSARSARSIVIGEGSLAVTGVNQVALGNDAGGAGSFAVSIGNNAIGDGANGVTVGANSRVESSNGVAIGFSAACYGDDSIVIGTNSNIGLASSNSIAIGYNNDVDDDDIVLIGVNNRSSANSAIGIGDGTISLGNRGISLGFSVKNNTIDYGSDAIAIGTLAYCQEEKTIAIGRDSESLAQNAIAIGTASDATALTSVAIGYYAKSEAAGAVQIGAGTNNTIQTLQFITNPIASIDGIIAGAASGAPGGAGATNEIRFDPGTNILYVYNGSSWVSTTLT